LIVISSAGLQAALILIILYRCYSR